MPRDITRYCVRTSLAVLMLFRVIDVAAASEELTLLHAGDERSYRLYVPSSYQEESPSPLLLVLHGRSSDGARMERLTGFDARAEEHGFVVAYPEALKATWNYLHDIAGYKPRPNDSEFLLEVVAAITGRYAIDTNRVYVTGISNGGFMAQRLACYAPERFAAFASVAAGGYGAMPMACAEYAPVNMLYIHGTRDAHVPWQGLRIKDAAGRRELVAMSIKRSLQFWSRRNGCGPEVASKELPQGGDSPDTLVRILTASECESGAEVSLYAVIGGGHNWPGSQGVIPTEVAGPVNMDIHASDVIWAFFQRHAPAVE